MTKTMQLNSPYMEHALNGKRVKERARSALRTKDFDTVVGRGFSGTLNLRPLATMFGVNMLAVRKSISDSHASSMVEGKIGEKWIFVDDFITSGETFVKTHKTIHSAIKRKVQLQEMKSHPTECVGAFLYANGARRRFRTIEQLRKEFPRIDSYFKELGQ